MQGLERQMLRFSLVLGLAMGVGYAATHAAAPKVAARHDQAPIVLAVALERNALPTQYLTPVDESAQQEMRVDQCAYNPHAISDNHLIGDKSAQSAKKRKIVVCG
jgi:hypothetical protein